MRSINANLTAGQKALQGDPYFELTVHTTDLSAYLLEYHYDEPGALTLLLDNRAGTFNNSPAYLQEGKEVELKRGMTIAGVDYSAELPTFWLEEYFFTYGDGQSILVLECIDWWERLRRWHATADQSWSATSAQTIVEWILTQVGLTLASGSLTSLTLDFSIKQGESGATAMNRIMGKLPEYLYAGIDKEIKFKELDSAEGVDYTFDWNADQSAHPVLSVEAGHTAWKYNAVTVEGTDCSGSDTDATQQTYVGARQRTIIDTDLTSNAQCSQRATAELDFYEAGAAEMTIECRPCHGLEQYDVVKIDNPPWGGADHTARCIKLSEDYKAGAGLWQQTISCGLAADKPGGHLSVGKALPSPSSTSIFIWAWKLYLYIKFTVNIHIETVTNFITNIYTGTGAYGTIPIGGIIAWSGAVAAIPPDWALCDGNNGTPDLRDRFVIGAGDTYNPDDTGGSTTADLSHSHEAGTLATANDSHSHDLSTLTTDEEAAHSHGVTSVTVANDSHSHDLSTLTTDEEAAHSHGVTAVTVANDTHSHDLSSLTTDGVAHHGHTLTTTSDNIGAHTHTISGSTASDGAASHSASGGSGFEATYPIAKYDDHPAHTHGAGTLAADSGGQHQHSVSGTTDNAGGHSHGLSSGSTDSDEHNHTLGGSVDGGGAHTHGLGSGTTDSDEHNHAVSGSTGSAGSGSQSILNPYYALAWIMRIS